MKIAEEWQLLRFENRLCREISIEMESNSATLGEDQIMLRKCETTHCQKSDQLCSREFTIIYSDSYEVPVMYFSMNDQSKFDKFEKNSQSPNSQSHYCSID